MSGSEEGETASQRGGLLSRGGEESDIESDHSKRYNQAMAKPTINYALAATLIATGVTLEDAAKQVGAKTADVLRVGLARKGVTAKRARALEPVGERRTSVALSIVSEASAALRAQFSDILSNHASKLAEVPAKANLKHLRQVGDALEPLARTAKIVHDWGSEQPNALVMVGMFSDQKPQETIEPAKDIQAVVVEETPSEPAKDPLANPA